MTSAFQLIDAPSFTQRQQQGKVRFLLDVRSPAEYRAEHVSGAFNVPLDQIDPQNLAERLQKQGLKRGDELYLICQTGQRARQAATQMQTWLPGVQVVEGGTPACGACGIALNKGRQIISLQRQVQISAGSLVMLGTLLGTLVNPAWYLLATFVGAGLTFAGVTNTCGMALLLARMPWNK